MPTSKKTTTAAKPTAAPKKRASTAAAASPKAVAPAPKTVVAKETARRRLTGTVVSDKMTNTISVRVDRTVLHAKYQKRYEVSKKYLVHDLGNTAKIGQTVVIEETRPLSARKRWRLVSIVK